MSMGAREIGRRSCDVIMAGPEACAGLTVGVVA